MEGMEATVVAEMTALQAVMAPQVSLVQPAARLQVCRLLPLVAPLASARQHPAAAMVVSAVSAAMVEMAVAVSAAMVEMAAMMGQAETAAR
jgi:hypothetical protein